MNWRMVYFGLAGTLMCSAGLQAATLMEMESEGEAMKIWFQGAKMRMESEGGYMLMDSEANKMYIVSPEEGMAMDMSFILAAQSKGEKGESGPKAVATKVGDGPEIAGYDTVHYRISVEGEHCQDLYTSKKAYKDLDAEDLFDRIQKLGDSDMEDMGEWSSPCDYADTDLDFAELGFPLRTEDVQSGGYEEVRRIVPDAGQPDGGFDVPAGLEVMDMSQMMQYMQRPPGKQ